MKLFVLLLSLLKSGKVLTTGSSMLLSLALYAITWGWRFALGFIVLLFLHEMGHYIAARRRGLAVGPPTFIPFVGAWIEMKEMPHNAEVEAYVAFGGPLLGTLASLVCYTVARVADSSLLLAIAYSGFFLNLFNLIPLSPLDGGRITAVLTPRIWLFGLPIMIGFFVWQPNPLLIVVAVIAIPHVLQAIRYDPASARAAYYRVGSEHRLAYSLYYLGLTLFTAMMTLELHKILGITRH